MRAGAWALALLCTIYGFWWIVVEHAPNSQENLATAACACALAAVISAIAARTTSARPARWFQTGMSGSLVLLGPSAGLFLGSLGAASALDAGALTIAATLTSVVIAVAAAALTDAAFAPKNLAPGILAAAALLLVLPLPAWQDWRSDAALILAPLLTGVGCVLFERAPLPDAWKCTASLSTAAVAFAFFPALQLIRTHHAPAISLTAIAIETAVFLLAFFALSRLGALRYSSRYLLVPLLLLIETPIVLGRELLTWRLALSAALLLLAAVWLLRLPAEENPHQETYSLR